MWNYATAYCMLKKNRNCGSANCTSLLCKTVYQLKSHHELIRVFFITQDVNDYLFNHPMRYPCYNIMLWTPIPGFDFLMWWQIIPQYQFNGVQTYLFGIKVLSNLLIKQKITQYRQKMTSHQMVEQSLQSNKARHVCSVQWWIFNIFLGEGPKKYVCLWN